MPQVLGSQVSDVVRTDVTSTLQPGVDINFNGNQTGSLGAPLLATNALRLQDLGVDFVCANKAEIVAQAAGVSGDDITLQSAIYFLSGTIDLTAVVPGTTFTSRLICPPGCLLVGAGMNSNSAITGNRVGTIVEGTSFGLRELSVANADTTFFAPAVGVTISSAADVFEVIGVRITTVGATVGLAVGFSFAAVGVIERCEFVGPCFAHISLSGAPGQFTLRNNLHQGAASNGILAIPSGGNFDINNCIFYQLAGPAVFNSGVANAASFSFNQLVGNGSGAFENNTATPGNWMIIDNKFSGFAIGSVFIGTNPLVPDPPQGAGATSASMIFMRSNFVVDGTGATRLMQETAIQTTAP